MFCLECDFERQILKLAIVRLDQVWKSGTESFVVGADQGIQAHQVDVVLDDDQVALDAQRIQSSRGVGDDQELAAQLAHHADRECHLPGRIALVQMETALPSRSPTGRPACRKPTAPCGSRPSTWEKRGFQGTGSLPRPRSRGPGHPIPCPEPDRLGAAPTSANAPSGSLAGRAPIRDVS